MEKDLLKRFQGLVDKSIGQGPTKECWHWQGSRNRNYGRIKFKGNVYRAHRIAWEIEYNRTIPDGMLIRHICNNPICVNPKHLEIGTHQDNMDDKIIANRQANGNNIGSSKLTEKEIRLIFELYQNGMNQVSISKIFNVSKNSISNILRGKSWFHLNLNKPKIRKNNGENNGGNKITEDIAKSILNDINDGQKGIDIAKKFKVSPQLISELKTKKRWKYLHD